jgi:hypothetical protein
VIAVSKQVRVELTPKQLEQLDTLLAQVPQRKVVQYDWTTEEGRAFVAAVRKVQLGGVPLPWIAEALDVTRATLNGAVGYWTRKAPSRSAKRRPLRRTTEGEQ